VGVVTKLYEEIMRRREEGGMEAPQAQVRGERSTLGRGVANAADPMASVQSKRKRKRRY